MQIEALSTWIKSAAAKTWNNRNIMLVIEMLISDAPSSAQPTPEATLIILLEHKWIPTQSRGECISILDVCIGGVIDSFWGAPRQCQRLSTAVQVALWERVNPEQCALERLVAVFESVPIPPMQNEIRRKFSRCADWEWDPTYNIGIDPGMCMAIDMHAHAHAHAYAYTH